MRLVEAYLVDFSRWFSRRETELSHELSYWLVFVVEIVVQNEKSVRSVTQWIVIIDGMGGKGTYQGGGAFQRTRLQTYGTYGMVRTADRTSR